MDVLKDAFANDEEYAPKAAAAPPAAAGVEGTWRLDLELVGVPTKDPSNDLYGPRVRIRDENRGISAEPCAATLRLAAGAVEVVACEPDFLEGPGTYTVSSDGRLAVTLSTEGFRRTFTTTGSLQSVFGGENTKRTSSVYEIPAGPIVLAGATDLLPSSGDTFVREGTVLVPEAAGLFGAGTRAAPAGSFSGRTGGATS